MSNRKFSPAGWNVGTRISAVTFLLAGAIIAALIATITVLTSGMLERRAIDSVRNELHGVTSTV